ncbi:MULTISPECIES: metallophosphoesterase family protein [unclassified Pseudomonas]|uniref:metallophosphoesterase family protein n=1 Tax=unclassified Pseudomonas TaxID=196821 RepID=UPI001B33505A|nr:MULTISPECIES: metallophosphoesterase family protein [unclassified Pseudomonas]MBP5947773.1 metallophosphoesterase family protein [Pseudomonas sp. P9(2020)]MBZ9565756.1 metallophosphoesterase family protein [Pseudomonas sp. P116]
MKTAIISDTHGLLRPEALTAIQGCDLILHAGDIGSPEILDRLSQIAPVQAVRGNNDLNLPWAANIPDHLSLDLNGWQTLLIHDIADVPAHLAANIRLIITGHSHKPLIEWRDNRLYLNPGSAGRRRFKLPVTLALLDVRADALEPQLIHLLP